MILHLSFFQQLLQPKVQQEGRVAQDLVAQQLETSHHFLLEVLVLLAISPGKEALKISTFTLEMKPLPLQPAQVCSCAISSNLANKSGYGIHYPIRHGQIENWVG
jgi:hypothetical protein